ncbi:MAG TPA: EamA family transporter [Bryobacteraceae bacterium]|nr:EamA family transporter [Bryobacteraceae bacterium]
MRDHPHFTAYLALICVCIFWGTTYLGIRIALDSFPPALLVCLRNLISGAITLSVAAMIGARLPRGRDLWITAGYGLMVIGVGNGTLAVVEQWIPTGLSSLFVTTAPFWFVGIDALLAGGEKLHAPTLRGLLLGFAGVFLLIAPDAWTALTQHTFIGGGAVVLAFVLLQVSGASWALGSLLQRNRRLRAHPFVIGGVQQLSTGLALLAPSIFQVPSAHWTTRGMGAIVYLAIFGGIVGYSCYALVIDRLPLAIASIYTYINPVVAVFLGWWVYRERFGLREAGAMAVIFAGVAMVRRASSKPAQNLRANRAAESG